MTVQREESSFIQKIQSQIKLDQSYLSLVLGLLIVLVAGILAFNYFKGNQSDLGPAQQAEETTQKDVDAQNLPGKYTVKEGDTLFTIAEKYYQDGYKFPEIAEVNKLSDENNIIVGQVLDIPKVETASPASTEEPAKTEVAEVVNGTGGAENQTVWGEKITGDTYTVVEGDWLSKIAGRAYGDVMIFDKIAQANNISDPDLIVPGQILKIPR